MLNLLRNRPLFAQYAITYRCNSRCESCAYWAKGTREELGLEEVSRLADELWTFGVRIVTITGGEPFMRREAVDIIRLFSRRGFRVTINTNGILLDKALISRLAGIPRLHIVVSLDSLDKKKYARVRGVDSLKAVLESLSTLKRCTPHEVRVFALVSSHNDDGVPRLLDFCKDNSYRISLYPVMAGKGQGWFTSNRMIGSEDDLERIAALFDHLAETSKRNRALFGFSGMYRGAARFLRGEPTGRCGAGEVVLQVSPDGRVSACPELEPFCDIRTDCLEEAYSAMAWKRAVMKCCTGTPCYIGCTRTLQAIRDEPFRFFLETAFKHIRSRSWGPGQLL